MRGWTFKVSAYVEFFVDRIEEINVRMVVYTFAQIFFNFCINPLSLP